MIGLKYFHGKEGSYFVCQMKTLDLRKETQTFLQLYFCYLELSVRLSGMLLVSFVLILISAK